MKVFLAGRISGKVLSECVAWRSYLKSKLAKYPVVFFDPLDGHDLSKIDRAGHFSGWPQAIYLERNLLQILNSDLIVANLDDFGDPPLIGTWWEIAWGVLLRKPVIVFGNDFYTNYPLVRRYCLLAKNVDQAISFLTFFLRGI